ncbi:caldesmon, putative [Entamoeba invadens IP1]|uniref:Caldesmon, putative n=1 Tax=Entamoeba invadens IP1 TaxID=370355 RepID=A0A0A1U9D8_ENTIV|nr:caldesmon, putative [Entamoeba invadens IP1]ELP91632.1 caldesmon, putative [Entamoeba invadens IP1]|eukprot:XP_004258403.1 caldesmon, putative [Entamoeba invadens IP1]
MSSSSSDESHNADTDFSNSQNEGSDKESIDDDVENMSEESKDDENSEGESEMSDADSENQDQNDGTSGSEMDEKEGSDDSISQGDGTTEEKSEEVESQKPKKKKNTKKAEPKPEDVTTLTVENLPQAMSDSRFNFTFSHFKPISSVLAKSDKGGRCIGIGYLVFPCKEAAQACEEMMDGTEIEGKKIMIYTEEEEAIMAHEAKMMGKKKYVEQNQEALERYKQLKNRLQKRRRAVNEELQKLDKMCETMTDDERNKFLLEQLEQRRIQKENSSVGMYKKKAMDILRKRQKKREKKEMQKKELEREEIEKQKKAKLNEVKQKREEKAEINEKEAQVLQTGGSKKVKKCFVCGKEGHYASRCPLNTKEKVNKAKIRRKEEQEEKRKLQEKEQQRKEKRKQYLKGVVEKYKAQRQERKERREKKHEKYGRTKRNSLD